MSEHNTIKHLNSHERFFVRTQVNRSLNLKVKKLIDSCKISQEIIIIMFIHTIDKMLLDLVHLPTLTNHCI